MKKIQISIFILLSILLTSCSNEGELGLDIKKNTIKAENQELKQEIRNEANTNNKEIEEIKEVKKITNNKEIVKHEDGNIYLYENGKQIDFLTTRATECKWNNKNDDFEISYGIINKTGKYGVIYKVSSLCGTHSGNWSYYVVNLENNKKEFELISNSNNLSSGEMKVKGNNLLVQVNDKYVVNELTERGQILKSELIKEGFVKSGSIWVKKIDLSKIVPDDKKKLQNQ